MPLLSVNPNDGTRLSERREWSPEQVEQALREAAAAAPGWGQTALASRCRLLRGAAGMLRDRRDKLARLATMEMGKLFSEAQREIEKCAWVCEHYADRSEIYLADDPVSTDAARSFVAFEPLGTILAIMPWNFPFWQVFRFAAPALAAGNNVILKHASNVSLCALAIEELLGKEVFLPGVFQTMLVSSARIRKVIGDPRVRAVTFTGSREAGTNVARAAGENLKKAVLELGGSDAFIVLEDADLEKTVASAVTARYQNAGQSCIAAKRFIVVESIAQRFSELFREEVRSLKLGDPLASDVSLAPMAGRELRDELDGQVKDAIAAGAHPIIGCRPADGPGAHYQASILDKVTPGMRAYDEELFGPVAAIIRVRDEASAVEVANDTRFGLGASVWTEDAARGEAVARRLQCGNAFVNGIVKSDPRLPFGGVKESGFGRELSRQGQHEFVNAKTVWVA